MTRTCDLLVRRLMQVVYLVSSSMVYLTLDRRCSPVFRDHIVHRLFTVLSCRQLLRMIARPVLILAGDNFCGAQGQGLAVPPIGFTSITAPFRHARGSDDDAVCPVGGEIAVDAKPSRARGLQGAGDHPLVAHFAAPPSSAIETSIDSLWTSIPTNMLRFAMTWLRCMWLCAPPHWRRLTHDLLRESGL
jgi:hypothetical protein